MAPAGPIYSPAELKALLTYVRLFQRAAESARESRYDDVAPTRRWKAYAPAKAAAALPSRIANTLARYAWHRSGTPTAADAIAEELQTALSESVDATIPLTELHIALLAGAYWLHPPAEPIEGNDDALVAFEHFMKFVNGWAQTLPPQCPVDEADDDRNRRFRAYQRRRNGVESSVRPPRSLVKRLPPEAHQLLEVYLDRLLRKSPESAYLLAADIAIALGRPMDLVAISQIEVALATALVWKKVTSFGPGEASHGLLGERPVEQEGAEIWDAAAARIDAALQAIAESNEPAVDPKMVQTAALNLVAETALDAESLDALSLLHDYVMAFGLWVESDEAAEVAIEQQVATFDLIYMRDASRLTATGLSVISGLPAAAVEVIAFADTLITHHQSIDGLADELSVALGDRGLAPALAYTLEVTANWLHGHAIEQVASREPVISDRAEMDEPRDFVAELEAIEQTDSNNDFDSSWQEDAFGLGALYTEDTSAPAPKKAPESEPIVADVEPEIEEPVVEDEPVAELVEEPVVENEPVVEEPVVEDVEPAVEAIDDEVANEVDAVEAEEPAAEAVEDEVEVNVDASDPEPTPEEEADLVAGAESFLELSGNPILEPFKVARASEAEAILDLGYALSGLIQYSQALGQNGNAPEGWWLTFHNRTNGGGLPTVRGLIDPAMGAARLLRQFRKVLKDESLDPTEPARDLAAALGNENDDFCVKAIVVALAVGSVWVDLESFSRGHRVDSLLGAEPVSPAKRLWVERAGSTVQRGLEKHLDTDSVPGV